MCLSVLSCHALLPRYAKNKTFCSRHYSTAVALGSLVLVQCRLLRVCVHTLPVAQACPLWLSGPVPGSLAALTLVCPESAATFLCRPGMDGRDTGFESGVWGQEHNPCEVLSSEQPISGLRPPAVPHWRASFSSLAEGGTHRSPFSVSNQ